MPHTKHFRRIIAGSTGQRKSILRNLTSSLIIHESITTTLTKARSVQSYVEKVITLGKKFTGRRDQRERTSAYLYDWKITLPKLFDELATRYKDRPGGYTRVLRLPPRFGDMAPQAILELVDGKKEMQWCMTARKVARSQLLETKWLSESTRDTMYQLLKYRGEEGVKAFDEEVERQKKILIHEDEVQASMQKKKEEKTLRQLQDRMDERDLWTLSHNNKSLLNKLKKREIEKRRTDSYISEEEKEQEIEEFRAKQADEPIPDPEARLPAIEDTKQELERLRELKRIREVNARRAKRAAERRKQSQKSTMEKEQPREKKEKKEKDLQPPKN